MLSDYLELPQVKFLIEHYKGVIGMLVIMSILLYVCMIVKMNKEY